MRRIVLTSSRFGPSLVLACSLLASAASGAGQGEAPHRRPDAPPVLVHAPLALEQAGPDAPARACTLRGTVRGADGAPAAGALVASSAGGQTHCAADGSFALTVQLPEDARALQLSAFSTDRDGQLRAQQRLELAPGLDAADPVTLVLAAGSGCQPDWSTTFGAAVGLPYVHAYALFDDGSGLALYAGGSFVQPEGEFHGIARWDGSHWEAVGGGLGGGSNFEPAVEALAVFDDGTGAALYAAGDFSSAGGVSASCIARWNGTSWSALGAGLSATARALVAFDDGTPALYVGGDFQLAGGLSIPYLARWNGASWSSLGSGVNSSVRALAVHGAGTPALYAGGDFTMAGGSPAARVARWNGSSWSALGSGASGTVRALVSYDDGTPGLFAGGDFDSAGGTVVHGLARWNGTSWTSVRPNSVLKPVDALAVAHDSGPATLVVGTRQGGAFWVERWNGTTWSFLGSFNGAVRALADVDLGGSSVLYAGGEFVYSDSGAPLGCARWNGSSWQSLGSGLDSYVFALAVHDDGSGPALHAGGTFFAPGGTAQGYGPVRRDGASWTSIAGGSYVFAPSITWWVTALASGNAGSGTEMFAGGGFSTLGGTAANYVARWNGASWQSLGSGLNEVPWALAFHDDGGGNSLFATGSFTSAGGTPVGRIARWSSSTWFALGSGLNGSGNALASFDDGGGNALYVGGSFSTAGVVAASRIARWKNGTWSALGAGLNDSVFALVGFDDGDGPALYAGGRFTTAGGVPANRVARWKNGSWSALGAGTNAQVNALCAFDDGTGLALYAGGSFTSAGGVAARRIARWDGTSWSPLGSGTSGSVFCLRASPAGSVNELLVGGAFSESPAGDGFLARYVGCSGALGTPFCEGTAALCPCGNGGAPGRGCDNAQASGGVELDASGSPGANTVVLHGSGFPPAATPGVVVLRSPGLEPAPVLFGDGLRCVGLAGLVRLGATVASGGSSAHPLNHSAGPGAFHYQLWYRSTPQSFCNPSANFNASNGLTIVWP